MKHFFIYVGILIMFLILFEIYKYGVTGYLNRRIEKRERRHDFVKNTIRGI